MGQEKKDVVWSVCLDPASNTMLAALAENAGISKAAIIRQLIRAAFEDESGRCYKCASGQMCMVPQMRPPRQAGFNEARK